MDSGLYTYRMSLLPALLPSSPPNPQYYSVMQSIRLTLFWWNSLAYRPLRHEYQSLQLYSPAAAVTPFMILPTWATSCHGTPVASFLKDLYSVYR